MPTRDLRGEPVPVGKVRRELVYDGLLADESPEWMSEIGSVAETAGDISSSRGELHLDLPPGEAGGYAFPPFDPDSFREVRLSVALRASGVSEGVEISLGIADTPGVESPSAWSWYQESGTTDSHGRMRFGADGEETTSDLIGIALDDRESCGLLGVRVRQFERGATVTYGGADRGNVAFEDAGLPMAFETPMYPKLLLDASDAPGDTGSRDDRESGRPPSERISLSKVAIEYIHD